MRAARAPPGGVDRGTGEQDNRACLTLGTEQLHPRACFSSLVLAAAPLAAQRCSASARVGIPNWHAPQGVGARREQRRTSRLPPQLNPFRVPEISSLLFHCRDV